MGVCQGSENRPHTQGPANGMLAGAGKFVFAGLPQANCGLWSRAAAHTGASSWYHEGANRFESDGEPRCHGLSLRKRRFGDGLVNAAGDRA